MTTSTQQAVFKVYKGDSSAHWRVRVDGVDVANCTCRQVVRVDLDTAPVIDAAVTTTYTDLAGVEWFVVNLTPTQTDGLTHSTTYVWVAEIDCPSEVPPVRREQHSTLMVLQEGAA